MTHPAPAAPSVEAAHADVERLQAMLNASESTVALAEAQAGDDYRTVACGGEVPADRAETIARLKAKHLVLEKSLERAQAALQAAERLQRTREVLAHRDQLSELAEERRRLATDVQGSIDKLARSLEALMVNARAMVEVAQGIRPFRVGAGAASVLTSEGHRVLDLSMASEDNLQFLVDRAIKAQLTWFRSEFGPGPAASDALAAQATAWLDAVDDFAGIADLDPADVAVARAEAEASA